MSSYKGTKLQRRRRARKFGFRARLKKAKNVLKTKRAKMRTRMAVVVKSAKQYLPK